MGYKIQKHQAVSVLQRIVSDHSRLLLQCGDWEETKSYFKFKNWWLKIEEFNDIDKSWWDSFDSNGKPDFKLVTKLKALKREPKEWSKTIQEH